MAEVNQEAVQVEQRVQVAQVLVDQELALVLMLQLIQVVAEVEQVNQLLLLVMEGLV